MRAFSILLTGTLITISMAGCSEGTTTPVDQAPLATDTVKASTYTPMTDPDGHYVSPLAQLMRDMTAFADTTKQRLIRGEGLPPYPERFKEMITAEATPGMMDHRTYDPFAFSYLHQLDSLYKVIPEQRQAAFDEHIQYCAACHGQVCPGPLVRIKKLRMPAPAN